MYKIPNTNEDVRELKRRVAKLEAIVDTLRVKKREQRALSSEDMTEEEINALLDKVDFKHDRKFLAGKMQAMKVQGKSEYNRGLDDAILLTLGLEL